MEFQLSLSGDSFRSLWKISRLLQILFEVFLSLWSLIGVSTEFLWSIHRVSLEFLWSFFGVSLEFLWSFFAVSLELLWSLCRVFRVSLESV